MKVFFIGQGNIGSPLARFAAPLLTAGADERHEIVLADHDAYEKSNLATQWIDKADVGRNKALAQARKLRALFSRLRISAHPCRLEQVPLGEFASSDVIISCLDSRAGRLALAERVWRSGARTWIDTGVSPDNRLARVTIYRPGPDSACVCCGWGEPEFASIEVSHPCGGTATAATGAPAALGALAASLAVLEFEKILLGQHDAVAWNQEIVISAASHHLLVTRLKRDANCRFDHQRLAIENSALTASQATLAELWELHGAADATLRVEGGRWLTSLVCHACRRSTPALVLGGRGLAETAFCPDCGGARMTPSGFHQRDAITRGEITAAQLALPLSQLGLRPREVVSFVRPDQTTLSFLLS